MNRIGAAFTATAAILLVGGCASSGESPLPVGPAAYQNIPERVNSAEAADTIQPGDRLAIRVFGEPELTSDAYIVGKLAGREVAGQALGTPRAVKNVAAHKPKAL